MVDYSHRERGPKPTPAQPAPQPAAPPPDYSRPPAAAPASGPISLSKVTLTKASPSISLTKQGSASGQLRVNLNWNSRPAQQGGFLRALKGNASLDLDLGCLYELADGDKGVIQALGRQFGALDQPPFIMLDGDDRSGANTAGENLIVNLTHIHQIRRILVFAYIYEGAPSWDQAKGVVTLFPQAGPQVEIRLDEQAGGARFCAIALFANDGGELSVRREVRYINGSQSDVDRAYGFGLRWTAGHK